MENPFKYGGLVRGPYFADRFNSPTALALHPPSKLLSIPLQKKESYTEPEKVPINSLMSSCDTGSATLEEQKNNELAF